MSKVRLLTKREVDVAKAKDRQREIDEGKKLADRVDALRRMAVEEEQKLELYRTQALSTIQEDINAKIIERDILLKEIKRLSGK